MVNIAVFASGTGSNAVNLVKTFNSGNRIRVALCLTDRENAPVMEKMSELGIPTEYFPRQVWKENPGEILEQLKLFNIQVIALAGFLCYLAPEIVRAYEGRVLNIHPSLLPAYGGKGMHGANVHRAVIEAGEVKSGATVHIVTENLDEGPIVVQREVAVLPDDTPESLEAKVHEVEYLIYPEAVMLTVNKLDNRQGTVSTVPEATENQPTAESEETADSETAMPKPPAIPQSVDDAWAEVLKVENKVPPVPQAGASSEGRQPGGQPEVKAKPWMQVNANAYGAPHTGQPNTSGMHGSQPAEPMPSTWLVWSVVMTILCCFVPGVIAIIQSARVSSKYYAGDIEGAKRASRNAEIWIIVSFVLGVISNTLYIPLTLAGFFG